MARMENVYTELEDFLDEISIQISPHCVEIPSISVSNNQSGTDKVISALYKVVDWAKCQTYLYQVILNKNTHIFD